MNNQEAIALLRNLEDSLDSYCELNEDGKKAFHMAIESLELFGNSEQLPAVQPDAPDTNVGDTIFRQAALDALVDAYREKREGSITTVRIMTLEGVMDVLSQLPSAQPPMIDEWCDDCKEYDSEKHCCPRWNRVIRQTAEDMKAALPHWIPCSERLPESEGTYFVTLKDSDGTFLDFADWNCMFTGRYASIDGDYCQISNVVAWMPLPQPWKEAKE